MTVDTGISSQPGNSRQEFVARLKPLPEAWNEAEALIKLAELTRGEVVIPAVNELRYAGRSIVTIMALLADGSTAEIPADAIAAVEHATLHLRAAKADSIEAVILFVSDMCDSIISELGITQFLKISPKAESLLRHLDEAKRAIVESRGASVGGTAASAKRDHIYRELAATMLPEIINSYISVRQGWQGASYREKRKNLRLRYLTVITSATAAIVIGFTANFISDYLRTIVLPFFLR